MSSTSHMLRKRTRLAVLASLLFALGIGVPLPSSADGERTLLLATTTSVQDSGLLEALLPRFTEQTGIEVRAVAVGTGAALRMGAEGNVDVLLTHAPVAEAVLVQDGSVESRLEIMQNYFVLAGPAEDPAEVRGAADVLAALQQIAARNAKFISRGDDSGTHKREVALFREAGLDPEARRENLARTGSGMGLSLQIAGQTKGYILSDIGTFLAFQQRTGLVALTGDEPRLRNVYSILRTSRKKFPKVHFEEAALLERFFSDPATAEFISSYGVERFGRALFVPISRARSESASESERKSEAPAKAEAPSSSAHNPES